MRRMQADRILIIGCCGSGKSTLARQLGERLGLPVVHLDQLFWRPGWVGTPTEEFDSLLARELTKARWIMDGNYGRTLPMRLSFADRVIFLDFSRWRCMWGVVKRIAQNYGKTREDMGPGCPERIDLPFLQYTWNFNRHSRANLYNTLRQFPDVPVYVFKNRRQVTAFLRHI